MRLEAMRRWSALVFDPARLVIVLARRGDDRGVDKRACLDPNCLGPELRGDLIEQSFVQVLSANGGHAGSPFTEQETLAKRSSMAAQSIKSRRSSREQRRSPSELPNAKLA